MANKYLICENCFQVIGVFEPKDIEVPLMAHMFRSNFPPKRQVPGPFTPGADWENFKCPYCPRRPIFEHDRIYCSDHENGRMPKYLNIVKPVYTRKAVGVCADINDDNHDQPVIEDAPHPTADDGYHCPDCNQRYQNKKRYEMYHKCKVRASNG